MEHCARAERPRLAAAGSCERVLACGGARIGLVMRRRRVGGGAELQRPRERRAGVRHRPRAERADVAARPRAGQTLYTQKADSLGGLLFRNVAAGQRLPGAPGLRRAESGPITVHSDAAAPWDPEHLQPVDPRQRLHVPDDPRRHAARDRRAPADQPGGRARRARRVPLPDLPEPVPASYTPPYPTLIEYSGYGYAEPGRPGQAASRCSPT